MVPGIEARKHHGRNVIDPAHGNGLLLKTRSTLDPDVGFAVFPDEGVARRQHNSRDALQLHVYRRGEVRQQPRVISLNGKRGIEVVDGLPSSWYCRWPRDDRSSRMQDKVGVSVQKHGHFLAEAEVGEVYLVDARGHLHRRGIHHLHEGQARPYFVAFLRVTHGTAFPDGIQYHQSLQR